jgi:large subunit ribosomal protein L18
MDKKQSRLRRARRTRARISESRVHRLCIHRTPRHIYAQVISPEGSSVLAAASTVDKQFREESGYGGNINAAGKVGQLIAERAKAAGITQVAFDRSGFKYHGRVKALAEAAREHGLQF